MAQEKQEAINSYVTDMQALEEHLEKALSAQVEDLKDDEFGVALRSIHQVTKQHIRALDTLSERRQGGAQGISKTVKRAASSVLGLGAAAIDMVRSEQLPKNLRDDYTAVSLACIGYVMLHTTAMSLGDTEVSELALAHLQDHAKSTMTLNNIVPRAVVQFLKEEGLPADESVLSEVGRNIEEAWQSEDSVADTAGGVSSGIGSPL